MGPLRTDVTRRDQPWPVPATSCEPLDQSSSSLEFEEVFELELDEPFELELDELFEFEFEELLELEFDELFELELEELFEFELDELFELELDEPFLPPPDHQLSSSATRTNSSCWLVAVPPDSASSGAPGRHPWSRGAHQGPRW
jgi:hypothetical protein